MSMLNPSRRGFLMATAFAAAVPSLALAAADPYAESPFRKLSDADWQKRLPRDA
jgi:peptide-methionine (R)-S-oxide reductase